MRCTVMLQMRRCYMRRRFMPTGGVRYQQSIVQYVSTTYQVVVRLAIFAPLQILPLHTFSYIPWKNAV